jgi:hypothetical protein
LCCWSLTRFGESPLELPDYLASDVERACVGLSLFDGQKYLLIFIIGIPAQIIIILWSGIKLEKKTKQ